MKKHGFKLKKQVGNITHTFGYQEVWGNRGIRIDLSANISEGEYSLVGLWVTNNLYPCYMKIASIASY